MTKCKVRREKDKLILELPLDVAPKEGEMPDDVLDVFPLRDGFFLIGKLPQKEREGRLSDEELGVLRKLDSFRFSQRIPSNVNAVLAPGEKKILDGLIQNKFVTIYSGGKYSKTGVYNIPKNIYPLLKRGPGKQVDPSSPEHMEVHGYMIVENEQDAKRIGTALEGKIKDGSVIGVRAFDKRFYLATKQFFSANEKRVREELGSNEKSIGELSSSLKMGENACMTVLAILCDAGDVIEKRRGFFALVQ